MSAERRKKLIQLSKEHSFIIISDEVYLLLCFNPPVEGHPLPVVADDYEPYTVLSVGSFSKIAAPGMFDMSAVFLTVLQACELRGCMPKTVSYSS